MLVANDVVVVSCLLVVLVLVTRLSGTRKVVLLASRVVSAALSLKQEPSALVALALSSSARGVSEAASHLLARLVSQRAEVSELLEGKRRTRRHLEVVEVLAARSRPRHLGARRRRRPSGDQESEALAEVLVAAGGSAQQRKALGPRSKGREGCRIR